MYNVLERLEDNHLVKSLHVTWASIAEVQSVYKSALAGLGRGRGSCSPLHLKEVGQWWGSDMTGLPSWCQGCPERGLTLENLKMFFEALPGGALKCPVAGVRTLMSTCSFFV